MGPLLRILQEGRFVVSWEAYPVCGDGLDFQVTFLPLSGESRVLANKAHEKMQEGDKPERLRAEVVLSVMPGDKFTFVVDPRANQDCDGLYIAEAKLWER